MSIHPKFWERLEKIYGASGAVARAVELSRYNEANRRRLYG